MWLFFGPITWTYTQWVDVVGLFLLQPKGSVFSYNVVDFTYKWVNMG